MMNKLFLLSACLWAGILTSCNDQDTAGNGTINLRITDAPTDAPDVAGVYLTFDRVEYQHEGIWH